MWAGRHDAMSMSTSLSAPLPPRLPERFFVAELIREKIFLMYAQEIPYSVQVWGVWRVWRRVQLGDVRTGRPRLLMKPLGLIRTQLCLFGSTQSTSSCPNPHWNPHTIHIIMSEYTGPHQGVPGASTAAPSAPPRQC